MFIVLLGNVILAIFNICVLMGALKIRDVISEKLFPCTLLCTSLIQSFKENQQYYLTRNQYIFSYSFKRATVFA